MKRDPLILPPPAQVWLKHNPGRYEMERTSEKDSDGIRYVIGSDHDELLEWANTMIVAGEVCPCTMPPRECVWTPEDDIGAWRSACGELWTFNDGGPSDNRVRYCHGCGKEVVIAEVEHEA